jgi:hypothetical protein
MCRCRLGSQQHEGVVAGAGSGQRLGKATTRPFLRACPCHSCGPPAGERHGRAMLVVPAGGTPRGPAARPATTRSPRARRASGAHPHLRRCGRGDEAAAARLESMASLSSSCCWKKWGRSGSRGPCRSLTGGSRRRSGTGDRGRRRGWSGWRRRWVGSGLGG